MPDWLTVAEAARLWRCSTDTIRRRIEAGEIEAKRFGPRLIRINAASLTAAGAAMSSAEAPSA